LHQLSHTTPAAAGTPISNAFGMARDEARADRLPWGSAALVLGGICLLLWAAVIAAVVAMF
jgi:hypothetical protein